MHVLSLGHRHTVCMDARGRVDVHPTYRKLPSESIAAPRPNRGLMRPFGILGCVIIYDAALSPAHIDKLINKPVQNIGLGTRIYIYIYISVRTSGLGGSIVWPPPGENERVDGSCEMEIDSWWCGGGGWLLGNGEGYTNPFSLPFDESIEPNFLFYSFSSLLGFVYIVFCFDPCHHTWKL